MREQGEIVDKFCLSVQDRFKVLMKMASKTNKWKGKRVCHRNFVRRWDCAKDVIRWQNRKIIELLATVLKIYNRAWLDVCLRHESMRIYFKNKSNFETKQKTIDCKRHTASRNPALLYVTFCNKRKTEDRKLFFG